MEELVFYFLNAISRFKHQNCLLLFKYRRKDIVEFSKKDKTSKNVYVDKQGTSYLENLITINISKTRAFMEIEILY